MNNKDNINIITNHIKSIKEANTDFLKPRGRSLDIKRSKDGNKPITVNQDNLNLMGYNTIKPENNTKLFLNTNKLPKIIQRLSLSNFHKGNANNNNEELNELNNKVPNKFMFNIFNRTSGITGFKGITFNKGIYRFRNTNYKITNINSINLRPLNSFNDTFKYKLIKEQLLNQNNNIQLDNKEKAKMDVYFTKNEFHSKFLLNNNNKDNKPISDNRNIIPNNKIKSEKNNFKKGLKERLVKDLQNNIYEENNDSFINELNSLFSSVKQTNNTQEQIEENDKNNESEEDKEPDPRINFEQINRVNRARPQTSYGGLNARKKSLQSAFQKKNRPTTSNAPEF